MWAGIYFPFFFFCLSVNEAVVMSFAPDLKVLKMQRSSVRHRVIS
jgi:hypothetical protein